LLPILTVPFDRRQGSSCSRCRHWLWRRFSSCHK
jgi:hypothetical protein